MLIKLKTNQTSGEELPPSTLLLVQIYFDTATFDNIERDKKIKIEGQLSLIGGTMGLLTGFSIISGVEIRQVPRLTSYGTPLQSFSQIYEAIKSPINGHQVVY